MRLIDADALLDAISVHLERIEQEFEDAPTIDPVRRGRWIEARLVSTSGGTYGVRRCSLCGADYQDVGYGWDYCPNCGAKMDGSEEQGGVKNDKNMILYICDGKACDGSCDLCTHTANIEHAKNFKRVTAEQIFVERERRGKWTVDKDHVEEIYTHPVICSECGEGMTLECGEDTPYCPNCGAKMDE